MSDVIKLLPDSVANQIAAGEVIQRPASVIKELVENSIDANATEIEIVLKEAGRTLIQVIDNGKGMSATDARLAFERHSTSKIKKAEDLFELRTMGFRGEALASIAAISQLELRTSRKEDQIGTKIDISASNCQSQEADVCPVGCNFMVKNIFFNVPARRKFLKSNQVELSNIIKEFEKLALINNNVSFTVIHNESTLYQFKGESFKQRIISLFGRTLEPQLIPLNIDTSLVKIDGFICRPENSRKRNFLQFLFVNGRYMRHPYFHKAIISSYGELIPDDEQPNYFLSFQVDPQSIDVNIHPTKTEIKFENESPIWQIISAAVKESLGKFSAVPSIDFDTEGAPEIPAMNREHVEVPGLDLDPTYNPFSSAQHSTPFYRPPMPSAQKDWDQLYKNFAKNKISNDEACPDDAVEVPETATSVQTGVALADDNVAKALQLKAKYILSPISSGLMIVDQHRAHVRILYDAYIQQLSQNVISSQRVLFPEIIHLSVSQNAIMEDIEDELNKFGFDLANIGGTDWSVNGLPTGIAGNEAKDSIMQVLESISDGSAKVDTKIQERIALSIAQSGAIPYGRLLGNDEMDKLLSDLLKLSQPNYTPDGKSIISVVKSEQIAKMF